MTEGDGLRQKIFDALEQRQPGGEPTLDYDGDANFEVGDQRIRAKMSN